MIKNKIIKKMAEYVFISLNLELSEQKLTFEEVKKKVKEFYIDINKRKILNLISGLIIKKLNTFFFFSEKKGLKRQEFLSKS